MSRRQAGVAEIAVALRSRRDLTADGWTADAIAGAVAAGRLHRVRRGVYADGVWWSELWAESRHLAHVLAVERSARSTRPVYGYVSAGVLWSLPLYRLAPRRVHVFMDGAARHSVPDLSRHEGPLSDGDVVERYGMRCTSLERTVYDLCRTLPPEAAIAVVDAALGRIGGPPRAHRDADAEHWRAVQRERFAASCARGIRQARTMLELGDGRAELPGESVSRLQLIRLGFRRPRVQVPVGAPGGGRYWVDLGLDDVKAFGEFDGKGKYLDEALRRGLTLEQVMLEEKGREDWIRGTTQWRMARWGDEHSATPAALGARLSSFGIRPPGR